MLSEMGKRARRAAKQCAQASNQQKSTTLLSLADLLHSNGDEILKANQRDTQTARQSGMSQALIDRLTLNPLRLEGIANDLRNVAQLPDPVGEIFDQLRLPNGLKVHKQRVPLGVIAVIYEARPNVTIDTAGLALKTGNAVILRGGSETLHTNQMLVDIIRQALENNGLPADAVQFIDNPDRKLVARLLEMVDDIDMLIPRGGAALHQYCREHSRIPVITGGIGICHLYVDQSADLHAAIPVIHNAKVQRPSVCNALDTLLVHRTVAADMLPQVVQALSASGVSFRAHQTAIPYLQQTNTSAQQPGDSGMQPGDPGDNSLPPAVFPAGENDFDTEWLSLVLGLKVVTDLDEAIQHISQHSTGHSDGILTQDEGHAQRFINEVDSAAVYINASTRFTDGGQLGLGAEVAISTQRLHARGPMGPRELTTYKWIIQGEYHVRQ